MEKISIMGKATRSAADLNAWLKSKNCPEYAALYLKAGEEFGVRGDMALFQSCLETGWFWNNEGPFDVKEEQHNYAGLGATGGGVPGDSFPDPYTGIRAQCQDLALRCNTYLPKASIISPYAKKQYDTISQRNSKTYEDLSGTWAADTSYHLQIYRIASSFDAAYPNSTNQETPVPVTKATWFNISTNAGPCVQAMAGGDVVETLSGSSVSALIAFLSKHQTDARSWLYGPYKGDSVKPPTGKKVTTVLCEPGHSDSRPGARSNDGSTREEKLNQHSAKLCQTLLTEAGYDADYYDPDPDNLTDVGVKARSYDVVISFHNNSYSGSGNPYHCIMTDPKMPAAHKQIVSRLAFAIERGANGTCADTVIFGGTNGIPGVYDAELTVINTSQADPDGKPPFHILPEFFFLNKMSSEAECKKALDKIIPEFAKQLMVEFPN